VRRAVVGWLVVAVLAAASGIGVVAGVNATVFGAAGFVQVYLTALARGDAGGALGMPGVTVDPASRGDFLTDAALAAPTTIRGITVEPGDEAVELVTVAWSRGGTDGVSTFAVERTGSRLGLFPRWAFAVSPVATLQLTVEHDARFELNGVSASSRESDGFAVLVPGVYVIDHHSEYLRAAARTVVADRPGAQLGATLDVQPTPAFEQRVAADIHDSLTDCATQEVLFPTGCPLGHAVVDRVASAPEWSIADDLVVDVAPGPGLGTWLVPVSVTSHLVVEVRSLFDGRVTTFDEDIPVTATYLATVGADDSVSVELL
jgi:hypothetical protein